MCFTQASKSRKIKFCISRKAEPEGPQASSSPRSRNTSSIHGKGEAAPSFGDKIHTPHGVGPLPSQGTVQHHFLCSSLSSAPATGTQKPKPPGATRAARTPRWKTQTGSFSHPHRRLQPAGTEQPRHTGSRESHWPRNGPQIPLEQPNLPGKCL